MARARTRQLYLPSAGILQDRIEQDLALNDWDEALELLVCLDTLGISNESHALARQCVDLLRNRLGATFPTRARKLDPIADAWEEVEALIATRPELANDILLQRLRLAWHKRFAVLLDRSSRGQVFRGRPAGWHHLQSGQPALAEASLSATVTRHPLEAEYWLLLADVRSQLGLENAAQAWLGLLLVAPLRLPLPPVDDDVSEAFSALPSWLQALYPEIASLALPGDPRLWLPAVGLCKQVFTWEMVPGKPVWDGNGTPKALAGIPGAFLSFYAMFEKTRKSSGGQRWQGAEAKRSLQRLAPQLYEKYF